MGGTIARTANRSLARKAGACPSSAATVVVGRLKTISDPKYSWTPCKDVDTIVEDERNNVEGQIIPTCSSAEILASLTPSGPKL
jgi:hypothetical protein